MRLKPTSPTCVVRSPYGWPRPSCRRGCLTLPYQKWSALPDAELVELGGREVATLGLLDGGEVVDAAVVRMPKAYPVYDHGHRRALPEIRRYLADFANLHAVGRNGQHRYNNQDHSMVTGVYAARNIDGAVYDLWSVNVEQDYHEEVRSS